MRHNDLVEFLKVTTLTADDHAAIKVAEFYPEWVENVEGQSISYGIGQRVRFKFSDGKVKLCKCKQAHLSTSLTNPELYPAGWDVIDVEHAGTIVDPIPYDPNMVVFAEKYYFYGEILYKCIRDSGQPLYATPSELLGNYFELV
ncbi:hypothetical protein AALA22_10720 [Anaerovoracaceae bacterium 41-7]|uniref:hypothetical protein n=1 Tax=Emergencia sp. JLR.KK010 TaxID=3114296 RepID=UPI0030D5283D